MYIPISQRNKEELSFKSSYIPVSQRNIISETNVNDESTPNYFNNKLSPSKNKGLLESVKNYFAPTENVRIRDVLREIPGETINVAKDILRAGPRAIASISLELAGKKEDKPTTKIEKFLLGEKPIESFQTRVEKFPGRAKEYGIPEKVSKPLAIPMIFGVTALDLYPGGSIEKKAGKEMVLDTTKYVAEPIVKQKQAGSVASKSLLDTTKYFLNAVKTKLVDFAAPIEDVLSTTLKKEGLTLKPSKDITNQIDRVLRTPTIAGQFVKDNGLDRVIREVDNIVNLEQYLIAKHATDVGTRGITTGRNFKADQQLIKDFAPKYEPYAKVVSDYSKKLLDYTFESGLINQKLWTTLKKRYPNYVPLKRIFSELEKSGTGLGLGSSISSLGRQTVVQKLKGSTREIESPLKSLIEKTSEAFAQGEKNKAASILANYKKLPGNPFQLRELKEGETSLHTISFLDKGVKKVYETTPEIAQAAKGLNVQQLNILGRIFALPVRVARLGITGINLPFIASNIAKDQVGAFINSNHALKTSIVNPDTFLKALWGTVGHGDLYQEMVRAGGAGTSFDIARNQIPATIKKIRAGKNIKSKILYTVKHPSELLRTIEDIVGRSEELTRMQQYTGTKKALLKEGLSEKEAIIGASRAARENSVNFARRGEWGTVLNSAFLYLNASIQGTRTLLRNLQTKPAQTSAKIALTSLFPMAVVTYWNTSDPKRKEAYNDIAEYEKQNNLIIVPPNPIKDDKGYWNVVKIPLSQEVNDLMGLVRRPIEASQGLNPIKFNDISKSILGTISPIGATSQEVLSTVIPQALKPTVEAVSNYSFFKNRQIVPQSMQGLSPELQAKPNTSGTVRKIGEMAGISPIKTEEFVKSTFGGIAGQILNASDRVLAGLSIIPKEQIGGESLPVAIFKRFGKAYGGRGEEETNKKLQEIITKQKDESFITKQKAELLYEELKNMSPEQANAKVQELDKVDPKLVDKLYDISEEQKKGLDYTDRLIKQLGVENGERAKFIWEKLNELKTTEEKNKYFEELDSKGLISDNIYKQLQDLKSMVQN